MIIGTGIDMVEISRIKNAAKKWQKNFLLKIFTDKELEYSNEKTSSYQHLAARFAAKEAVLKALGSGLTSRMEWRDIEVWNEESGKPNVRLTGEVERVGTALGVKNIIISMSHTRTYAVASVILVNGKA
ncbi:MAG: holo-ACP synthase [Candidatus Orphnella occulta]|nr:holo-ACP synthase [Candidatus Orphnella occulta]MDP8296848.1 holo-ACP synthase [Candidatus Orphnella occulta]